MARRVTEKILVEAKMTAETPISIGGMGAGDAVDLEVTVNGRGKPFIPGTSLMGPLRAWFEQRVNDAEAANTLFGYQKDDEGHASFLVVEDAELMIPEGLAREIRDGIGIDRRTGTAEEEKKFTRAVLPRGTSFKLRLELDLLGSDSEKVTILRCLLDQLKKHGLLVGASKSRGLGRLKAEYVRADRYVFSTNGAFERWLNGEENLRAYSEVITKPSDALNLAENDYLDIAIDWQPRSPVMVKSGADGGIADMLPLVSGYDEKSVTPVIPGSSVKGVLRAHAEKILRTCLQSELPDSPDYLTQDLFGSTEAAGRFFVQDVYQNQNTIDVVKWTAEDKSAMDGATDHHDNVAIDRFTGGASDTALFNDRTPKIDKAWDPIRIQIDFGRPKVTIQKTNGVATPCFKSLDRDERYRAVVLTLLVLRDMQAGWVPVGFGSRRGLGEIEVTRMSISGKVGEIREENERTLEKWLSEKNLRDAWTSLVPKLA